MTEEAQVVDFPAESAKEPRYVAYWDRKLSLLFKKAAEAGKEERQALVGAFMCRIPGFLKSVGAPDLAAAVEVRFFQPIRDKKEQAEIEAAAHAQLVKDAAAKSAPSTLA